ncbi:MAG: chloride channel protein [Clostridia bacterium]|nr:chloride channel protein [Clostridia bacterium]
MKKRFQHYLMHLLIPAFVFGSITGILTAFAVTLYKVAAHYVIALSEKGYAFLREKPLYSLAVLAVLGLVSLLLAYIYKKIPNLKGGGIPTSIGILRGIITFKWLRNLLGVFALSLITFLSGVPLGNEGPSVQMGTAIGRGTVYTFAGKNKAWDRYSMTGGACAGFSVATGAPISGIMFAIEEAHQRLSPMIIIVSSTSVMFASITAELLAPIFGVSTTLFPAMTPIALTLREIWIPLTVGLCIGLFAVAFLYYYRAINQFFNKKLKKVPHSLKLFAVFALTLGAGLLSPHFISTGHDLILSLFDGKTAVWMLFLILLLRSTLTLSANTNKLTGGMFVPFLALGAIVSATLGEAIEVIFGLSQDYYTVILIFGITACIAAMMKTPITAIVFAVEALGCYDNILYVIIVAAVSFVVCEMFGAKSVNDAVVEDRVEELNEEKTAKVIDAYLTLEKGAFAIGKQIRDIFWPANLFVLSVKHGKNRDAEVDEHGGKALREGDILHVRYSTFDEAATREELSAIVGGIATGEKVVKEV